MKSTLIILKKEQKKLLYKQNEKITILKNIDIEKREQDYFDILKELDNIQEKLEINEFEIKEIKRSI